MKMNKKETGDGTGFARKEAYEWEGQSYEADIQHGDIVTFQDAGQVEAGQFGEQHNFKIDTRNGVKKVSLNQSSINTLVEAYGDESEAWVGKKVKVWTRKDVIAGKRVLIAYFLPSGYTLDEYGDILEPSDKPVSADNAVAHVGEDGKVNVRGKDYPEGPVDTFTEEELKESDIPF